MSAETPDSRKVFVVHGRNDSARKALFAFLRSIGLHPLEWSHALAASGKGAPFIGEVLDSVYSKVRAVVVLLTGDDLAKLAPTFQEADDSETEKELTPQARPNVLFEAGLAFGRHPDNTILVQLGVLRPFSDIAGRHVIRISNAPARRQDLADRLRNVGCSVDLSGTDWLSTSDFDSAIPALEPAPPSPTRQRPLILPSHLHETERAILQYLQRKEDTRGSSASTAQEIADALSLPVSTIKHRLSELEEKELANESSHHLGKDAEYHFTPSGRELAIRLEESALTGRERQVIDLLVKGVTSNRKLGERLEISEAAAKVLVRSILDKLGVHNRMQVVEYALTHGIVKLE